MAIGISALVHGLIVWHGLKWASVHRPTSLDPYKAITIRLLPADAPSHEPTVTTTTAAPPDPSLPHSRALPPRQDARLAAPPTAAQLIDMPSGTSTTESVSPALTAPPPASTQDLLDRIAKGVLTQSRQTPSQAEAARKPWDKASQPRDREQTGTTTNAQGQRSERVRSALGDYCVNSPNPATAYRSSNGLNIAPSGNCP
jgi:hypothetical protein